MNASVLNDEISRLQSENRILQEDLRQCQNDKDFVWSLWKKLQVANPDVTQAISLVVQREKEKAEIKDRKVLEVLQMKDDKIEELQTLLTHRSQELGEIASLKLDHQEEFRRFQKEIDQLRDQNAALEMQLRAQGVVFTPPPRFSWKMRSVEVREKSSGDLHRNTVENLSQDKSDLEQKCRKMSTEIEVVRAEKESIIAQKVSLENKVRQLERDIDEKVEKFEGIIRELGEAKKLLQQYDIKTQKLTKENEFKNKELETVRKELSELWNSHNQLTEHSSQQADLIRQLQSLQQDTQKMLKNQEDAYSMETNSLQDMYKDLTNRYEAAKKSQSEMRQEVHNLRKELLEKDSVIASLQGKVDSYQRRQRSRSPGTSGSFIDEKPSSDLEIKVRGMQREINLLKDELEDKDRLIERLEQENDKLNIEFDVSGLNKRERTHSTPAREVRSVALSPIKSSARGEHSRSRSLSPVRKVKEGPPVRQGDLRHRLLQTERKLDDTKNMLRLKNRELEELKKAHAKRLDRLKSAQIDYKILKDQLKLYEDENSNKMERGRKKKRADPRDLRQENSDKVWNELAVYKNENRNLVVEKMSLEEEIDMLKVQASQDAATLHELKVALEQERESRKYDKKKAGYQTQEKSDLQAELTLTRSEVQSKSVRLDKLERELRESQSEKEALLEERRNLKSEILEMKQANSKHRMETANLKRDINRLERELEEEKLAKQFQAVKEKLSTKQTRPRSRRAEVRNKSQASKRVDIAGEEYQKALNKSIEKMRSVFRDFEDEGWEEIPESEEIDEETESDSLGQTIVDISQSQTTPPSDESMDHRHTIKRSLRPMSFKMSSLRNRRGGIRNLHHRNRGISRPYATRVTDNKKVTLREVGTSPLKATVQEFTPSPRIQEQRAYEQRVQASNQLARQAKQLKQRVGYLTQQITTLRESRGAAVKGLEQQKEVNQQLQADLNLANQRLRMAKQNIQKLTTDMDKVLQEKATLEAQIVEENRHTTATDKHTEQDWKILESRLKASSNELCRQSNQARQLKQENEQQQEQIRTLQEKISRVERDNNQKRTLLEDQRVKLKLAQTNAKSEQNANEEMETRIKLIQDTSDRLKIQVESYKKRLSAVTREKREYEERFLKVNAELEKKNKHFLESQTRRMELESAVGDLENTAQQQLRGLAAQSEAAIEAAQRKLSEAYYTIQQYQQFVKSLGHELIKRLNQSRFHLKETLSHREKESQQSQVNASLQRAQAMAKDILNLSQSDLEDIMSADGDPERMEQDIDTDKKRDKRWSKKCEKLMNTKEDFVSPLVDLFVQKMEEMCELSSKLQAA
ncbi:centlein-like isoform X1 [Saccostrea echinata]|uniref:centlein-like isoform X1 n=1 Tax=Saccostrea echinata TaxID=191078 RepID=UPI002A82B7D2|nr:centlein-like isoform X1 [Saccostrea echinata]